MLQAALAPRSVAVIGASDNPHKVGGRPILYLRRYGYRGAVYPVNPGRATVQGLRAFARVEDLPEAPELAIVAVAGDEASYRYLAESIRMHPDQETLKEMMERAGLEKVDYFNMSAGVVALHRGFKF